MPRRSLIHRRNGSDTWYVRVFVPAELREHLGRKEIWRTLGTADRKLASRIAPAKIAEIQKWMEDERAAMPRRPGRAELEDAVRRFYADEVQADLDERALEPERIREHLSADPSRYRAYAERLRSDLVGMNYDHVTDDARDLLHYERYALSEADPLYAELKQLLMRARLEAARRWSEHDQALFGEQPTDPVFRTTPAPRQEPSKTPAGKPLLSLFEDYARARSGALRPNTIDDSRKSVQRFAEFVGLGRTAPSIDRAEARAWRDLLRDWPQYANQAADFDGLDFKAVLAENRRVGRAPISLRTANKYLADLSSFYDWLVREDHVQRNIFEGLSFERSKDQQLTYPFSARQLTHLMASPLIRGCKGDATVREIAKPGDVLIRDWRYWILLLGLYTGARQGEIAQLELADVCRVENIDFIHITNEGEQPGKSVKAAYSKRRVPIHSRLIQAGFLDYVATRRGAGDRMLFPEVRRDSRGHFSQVSKFYQKYFDAIGLRKMESFSTNFHSLRHSFIDELRRNHHQDDEFKGLIGHAGKSVTSGYGVREVLGLPRRQALVESVKYDGLPMPVSQDRRS